MEEIKKGSYEGETEKDNVANADQKPQMVLSGRARKSSNWTEEEDDILRKSVEKYEGKCWKRIAACLPRRTDVQCLHRWQKVLNPELVKGNWTKEEDDLLIELVGKQGNRKWSAVAKHLPGRIGKQCRERWWNNLNPDINKAPWTKEEEMILIHAHSEYGNRWSEISKLIPGRTENSVKNHWNCSLKKKLGNYLSHNSALNPAETKPDQSNKLLMKKIAGYEKNEDSCCLDLVLGYSSNCAKEIYTGRDNTNLIIHDKVGKMGQIDRSYTGLCYKPIQMANVNILLSNDKFSGCDYNLDQPSRLIETCISLESILRSAAENYDNVPSIIRKRAIKKLQKDSSTPDKVVKVDDDQIQGSSQSVAFSPKIEKLEKIQSVGRCLEKAFSDA